MSNSAPPAKRTEIPAETPVYYASRLIDSALQKLSSGSSSPQDVQRELTVARDLLGKLDPYLDAHSTYPAYLEPLLQATATHDWAGAYARGDINVKLNPHFSAGPYEGAWIGQFVRSTHARKVLEVGMFTGTTTLAIAENLPKDKNGEAVHVTTLEIFDYLKKFVTPHFEKAGYGADKISVLVGKASESIAKLGPGGSSAGGAGDVPEGAKGPYDLIFIDADKPAYEGYYTQIMDGGLLKKTGTLLIDNTLYKGAPFTPGLDKEFEDISKENAEAMVKFNEMLVKDERVHVTLLPVRDGVSMVTWK